MRYDPTLEAEAGSLEEQMLRQALEQAEKPTKKPRGKGRLIRALKAAIPQRKVEQVTLTENEQRNGYELRFPGPIDDQTSALLRANGWRFLPNFWKDPLWYRRRSPESRAFAIEFAEARDGLIQIREEISRPPEPPAQPQRLDNHLEGPTRTGAAVPPAASKEREAQGPVGGGASPLPTRSVAIPDGLTW
jgi:hypothetical protein